MWGKAYKYFPLKISFLLSILLFEIGSLICGKFRWIFPRVKCVHLADSLSLGQVSRQIALHLLSDEPSRVSEVLGFPRVHLPSSLYPHLLNSDQHTSGYWVPLMELLQPLDLSLVEHSPLTLPGGGAFISTYQSVD